MGDSYSSGEGNPPFINTPYGRACDDSDKAWPYVLAGTDNRINLVANLACSGAIAKDISSGNDLNRQLLQLTLGQVDPTLVTVTIGGNDVGFIGNFLHTGQGGVIEDCFLKSLLPGKSRRLGQAWCVRQLHVEEATIYNFGQNAFTYYQVSRAAAPHARVIIVGYPKLFPGDQSSVVGCGWLNSAERDEFNHLADLLDYQLHNAAKRAEAEYVSTLDAFHGHELCTRYSWVNPIEANPINSVYDAHPNPLGQLALAEEVKRKAQL